MTNNANTAASLSMMNETLTSPSPNSFVLVGLRNLLKRMHTHTQNKLPEKRETNKRIFLMKEIEN